MRIKYTWNKAELAERLKTAKKNLDKANVRTINGATLAGMRFARRIAPRKTGSLIKNITRRSVVRKGKVVSGSLVSTVNKNFPYHLWVNEDIKRVRLPIRKTRFGKWPKSSTRIRAPLYWTRSFAYRETRHTGVPGYFRLTHEFLRKKFPEIYQNELKKSLKMSGLKG